MPTRRRILAGLGAAIFATPALAQMRVEIPQDWLPRDIEIQAGAPVNFIQVDTASLWLYLTTAPGVARRYKIAVGAAGRNFSGVARVGRKAEWPAWTPTANMIRQEPEIYLPYRNGLPGGHEMNPMGARALYLYTGNRDTLYRIHGTPQPWTIGQAFGSGCVRMLNDHAIDLYDRVVLGTQVLVT